MSLFPKVSIADMYQAFCTQEKNPQNAQYDKVRSCLVKEPYATREIAEKAVVKANTTNTGQYESYKCRWCSFFHIGHIRGTKKKYDPIRMIKK